MIEKRMTVKIQHGLHARPASLIVSRLCAMNLERAIIVRNGVAANLKSVMDLLSLFVESGAEVEVKITGSEEEPAMRFVEKVLSAETVEVLVEDLKGK